MLSLPLFFNEFSSMYIDRFLTEYDESLTGEMNIDPLGQLVIWSSWGQAIFHSRITSIANDVRQYTLNLLHHSVIREIIRDDAVQTAGAMKIRYPKKQAREFIAASLIHLENIYIYSMLAAEQGEVTLAGVQGINKARAKWHTSDNNPQLIFGHSKESELLTNQLALGTNGRYKSPMISMRFFTTSYDYDLPDNKPVWEAAEAFIQQVHALRELRTTALAYLKPLMAEVSKDALTPFFSAIPDVLKSAFVSAFLNPKYVGNYSQAFWLGRTGLNKNGAGAIYQVLKREREYPEQSPLPVSGVFHEARKNADLMAEMDDGERRTLDYVIEAEPFLSLADLMFAGLRRQSQQTLADFAQFWKEHGLTEQSLPELSAKLAQNADLVASLSGTPGKRFRQLLELASRPSLEEQVRGLLNYHNELMEIRGQFPWLGLDGDTLTLQTSPAIIDRERKSGDWVNHYYIPQFRNLLDGLWGDKT